jgi:hydroxymethylpyrimidine/phosphomethylpyrimidine kinase
MPFEEERIEVLEDLNEAVRIMQKCKNCISFMPEVRINLVYSIPNPKTTKDVAAIDGRITVVKGQFKPAGEATFGASDHMARLILEIVKYDSKIRAGINFKYDPEIFAFITEYCAKQKIRLGQIDRTKEPMSMREVDGMSIPWKIKILVESYGGKVPEIFYESEGWGKEPLFVMVGKDPISIVEKMEDIREEFVEWRKKK